MKINLITYVLVIAFNFTIHGQCEFEKFDSTLVELKKHDSVSYYNFNNIINNCKLNSRFISSKKKNTIISLDSIAHNILSMKTENPIIKESESGNPTVNNTSDPILKAFQSSDKIDFFTSDTLFNSLFYIKLKIREKINDYIFVYSFKNDFENISFYRECINLFDVDGIDWSPNQKDYINQLLKKFKIQVSYYEVIEKEFYKLVKHDINKDDLKYLKELYKIPIQQSYIENKLRELELY